MPGKQLAAAAIFLVVLGAALADTPSRPRAPDLGLKAGVLPRGPLDAITDVAGVAVGQTTIVRGDNIRTGVTQVDELGELETPIRRSSACWRS